MVPNGIGLVSTSVAVGSAFTSKTVRCVVWLSLLVSAAMSTLNEPRLTVPPDIVIEPQTFPVRPVNVESWPTSTCCARQPTIDPDPALQTPSTGAPTDPGGFAPTTLGSASIAGAVVR